MHDNNLSFFYPRFKMKAWNISEMFSLTKVNKHALINLPWFAPLNKNSCKGVLPTLRKVIRYWFFFNSFLTGLFYSYTIIFTLPPLIYLFFLSALLFCANLRPFFFLFPQSSLNSDFCFDPFEMRKFFVTNRTTLFRSKENSCLSKELWPWNQSYVVLIC